MRFRSSRPEASVEAPGPTLPETMRAAVLDAPGEPDALHAATVPVPTPILSEVLVRIVAAGINPIDAKTRAGRGACGAITSWPATLGYDFSGVVVQAPYEGHPFPPGTEVFGMTPTPRTPGTYAEYAVVPSLSLARKPTSLSHVEAAGVPLAALTAWGLVVETALAHANQRILIHAGSGGVGHFAVQFAAYFGAHVIATGSPRNLDWLRELGAAEVVDHTAVRFEDAIAAVDVVVDLVGNVHDDTGTRSLEVLRPGGLLIEVPTGAWTGFREAASARGIRSTGYKVIPDGSALATIARLLDSGAVRVFVDRVFDLEDAADAHRELEKGHTRGKIVLRVSDD
ncbi:NADP-dependent oxidoreductase [Microbacterium proteolyticum]|uniref:NADP-dependent oxidoreductase n=1 Tax=Microbacterium TaxID=33882 RepID=UPI00097C16CC|nr:MULTISPECIES: NADP-dependent oxidoreductase [Microbacterium]MDI9890849.1 NADP-dependent oxidoreductase [Microbacterium sp. IEGM 1404]MXS74288.1 NADP-dependent oxidoreductase [Microbacterium sp. TL13]ONI62911.1 NADPH:quinone reductase [Microbacterium sp. CSI-V]